MEIFCPCKWQSQGVESVHRWVLNNYNKRSTERTTKRLSDYWTHNQRRTYNDCFKSTQERQNLERRSKKGAWFVLMWRDNIKRLSPHLSGSSTNGTFQKNRVLRQAFFPLFSLLSSLALRPTFVGTPAMQARRTQKFRSVYKIKVNARHAAILNGRVLETAPRDLRF